MKYPAISLFAIRAFAKSSVKNLVSTKAIFLKSWRSQFAVMLSMLFFLAIGAGAQTNVVTQHNDISRTGQNLNETILTPANVNSNTFGKLFSYPIDGQAYAQPLYVAGVTMGSGTVQAGTTHNVVFVVTEHDSVYAFDADNGGSNASPLWRITLLDSAHGAGSGATPVPNSDVGTDDINPEIGITATPVIDTTTNTIYVVGKTKESGNYFQRLHALDITTGAEKSGSPVTLAAQVNGNGNGSSGGVLRFDAKLENNRAGLLLLNGIVYIAFAAHGDQGPYHGWILAYNAATLQQTSVFCATANGAASGIWMSGTGLAADTINSGRLFVATGNGAFNAIPPYNNNMSYGDDIVRLETNGGAMRVSDQFTAFNQFSLSGADMDLGSGGVLLLPDQSSGGHTHLMVQAGKEGRIYLVDRDNLGGYNSNGDNIVEEITSQIGGLFGSPAYWNGHLYFWASNDSLKSFSFSNGIIGNPTAASSENVGFPGPTPSISANGNSNGIVWDVLTGAYTSGGSAVLLAHNASNVSNTLYTSNQNSSRDTPGGATKFVVPTITNGKVYVGTSSFLSVYGLLGASPQAAAPVVNPAGESFTGSVSVTITDSTPGASIFYSTNGGTPTTSSTRYTGPINVTASETIKAIASASGYLPSAVTSETYNLQTQSGGSSVNFGSGFGSAQSSMTFNGSAGLTSNVLQLTNGGANEGGSAWFNSTVNITQFTNDFAFQLLNPNADGFTFTIQNSGLSALGMPGGSLGYAGIGNSVAVKFDLYNNGGEGVDSTGLYQNGAVPVTPASDLSSSNINLHSGDKFSVHMTYDGAALAMSITDATTGAVYNTSWPINIPQVIGSNNAYVGFTGATGGLTATQNIQSWSLVSSTQQQAAATAPILSPVPGNYAAAQSVSLSTPTSGGAIHYTTDGSTPTASSALYSQAISVTATETIKALTIASGYSNSSVSTGVYSISSGSPGGGVSLGSGFTAGAMALNGSATLNGTRLRLTDGGGSEAASAWYNSPVNIQQFTTSFSFQIAPGSNPTADGFTFAIQDNNTTALGLPGGALGYGSGAGSALSQKSVAVKFDLYDNAGEGTNSTGLYTNGAVPTSPSVNLTGSGVDLHSGDVMNVQISYDGTNLTMTITDPTANATFTNAWPVNIPSVVGGNTAFVGFTAGTGGLTAIHDILNWTLTSGTSGGGGGGGSGGGGGGGGGASTINFASGFSATGMQFNGNAQLAGNRLQLSDTSSTFENSSAFWNQKVSVQGFTNDFTFQITNPGADGITFAIQGAAPTALGAVGGGLGYTGMGSSVAVKFDIYNNTGEGSNSTGLYLNGAVPTVPATNIGGGVNMQSGDVMAVHMSYDGATLTMTITDTSNPAQTFTTSWPVNIAATAGSSAYVGFTGSTGGLVSTAQILTWSYNAGNPPLVVQTTSLVATAATSGPALQVFSYQNFPDGLGTMFFSTNVGDNVTFPVSIPAAGTYDVKISYKQYQPRGIAQTAINGTSFGPPIDEFVVAQDAYGVSDLGARSFPSAGNYLFTFTVVGKNPASSGYSLTFDTITLTPQ